MGRWDLGKVKKKNYSGGKRIRAVSIFIQNVQAVTGRRKASLREEG